MPASWCPPVLCCLSQPACCCCQLLPVLIVQQGAGGLLKDLGQATYRGTRWVAAPTQRQCVVIQHEVQRLLYLVGLAGCLPLSAVKQARPSRHLASSFTALHRRPTSHKPLPAAILPDAHCASEAALLLSMHTLCMLPLPYSHIGLLNYYPCSCQHTQK